MNSEPICVKDFEKLAATKLPKDIDDYFRLGCFPRQTLQDNVEAFRRYRFRPRFLRDVSKVDLSTTVQGSKIPFPICISPTALHKLAHQDGELATASAAGTVGALYIMSMLANCEMEDVKHIKTTKWSQCYLLQNRETIKHYVKRAEENGFQALVLTIDDNVPRQPQSYHTAFFQTRSENYAKSADACYAGNSSLNAVYAQRVEAATWESVEWLKRITDLPVIVKGILTREMALEAVEHGVDGILVSNHGGRVLDGVSATIDALPEVVKAVNGRCEVYMDGGIRSGNDVAKAIALGAKAVFIGRPAIWGLACDGENGVRRVLEILRDEFETTMKLLGVTSIEELQKTPNLVVHEREMAKF